MIQYFSWSKRRGLNLIEILVAVSIFSILGLLISQITTTFVELYTRSRDQADLLRLQRLVVSEISDGDNLYFDGIKSAPEIIEANDLELSFVPMYRDSSEPAGFYVTNGLFNNASLGPPPPVNDTFPGGLRIQYNDSTQKYELRYYLSKLPRPGAAPPEVYIKYDSNTPEPLLSELKANLNIFSDVEWNEYVKNYHPVTINFKWEPPRDTERSIPSAYVVFNGGNFPLELEGDPAIPPSIFDVSAKMRNNRGQLFPDPFNRPGDQIILYYHPETEFAVIKNQQHLIARLFIKGGYPDIIDRFEFSPEAIKKYNDSSINGVFDRSLCLYYDNKLTVLPSRKELISRNIEAIRPQFLLNSDIPAESNLSPSQFSYFNSRDTTNPIQLTLIDGRTRVPADNFHNIALIRFDFLNILGQSLNNFTFSEIFKRNYAQIVPLQNLSYTHSFHTKSTILDNSHQGFSPINCFQSQPLETKCKLISKNFPSGKQIRISQAMFMSNIMIDSALNPNIDGWISYYFRNPINQKVYQVKIDFDKVLISVMLKNAYDREDLQYIESNPQENVVEFPMDNSQFINFNNLQANGFLDEGFNYSNSEVFNNHLGDPDFVELYVEMKDTSNIEGFSLTWRPK